MVIITDQQLIITQVGDSHAEKTISTWQRFRLVLRTKDNNMQIAVAYEPAQKEMLLTVRDETNALKLKFKTNDYVHINGNTSDISYTTKIMQTGLLSQIIKVIKQIVG